MPSLRIWKMSPLYLVRNSSGNTMNLSKFCWIARRSRDEMTGRSSCIWRPAESTPRPVILRSSSDTPFFISSWKW
ncbi:hypothetical protein D3C83_197140 [compost metagenome]